MNKAGIDNGTIFYIIIAVIAAITSIVQKKKKTDTHEPASPGAPKRTWEEVLTDSFDIPETKQAHSPKPVTKTVQTTVKKRHTVESSLVTSRSNIEIIDNEGVVSINEENEIKMGEIGSSTESISKPKFDFDLKKAVIYSEILSRKY
jgi:hypothetical protein